MRKLLFLGPGGSHSETAAIAWAAQQNAALDLTPTVTIPQIYGQVDGDPEFLGLVPVENSIGGDVAGSFERLFSKKFQIHGEIYLQIKHHLLGLPDSDADRIDTVLVHPQAALQCAGFLAQHADWKQITVSSTSLAAQTVLQDHNPQQAAISGLKAAEHFGLRVLQHSIGDFQDNYTRFLLISGDPRPNYQTESNSGPLKYSIVFQATHTVGSLSKILDQIADLGGNLTKIESRPLPQKPWNYIFFADFIARSGLNLQPLQDLTTQFCLLGAYEPGQSLKEE